jgi:anti-sigma28 factor (negative regulator of flagellin synthesis)
MEITPTNQTSSAQRVGQKPPVTHGPAPGTNLTGAQAVDRVELSPVAMFASRIRAIPDMRHEKIAELKKLISSGKYETPQKIEKAAERFLKELE